MLFTLHPTTRSSSRITDIRARLAPRGRCCGLGPAYLKEMCTPRFRFVSQHSFVLVCCSREPFWFCFCSECEHASVDLAGDSILPGPLDAWRAEYESRIKCWRVRIASRIYEHLIAAPASKETVLDFEDVLPTSFRLPCASDGKDGPAPTICVRDYSDPNGCGWAFVTCNKAGNLKCSACFHRHCAHIRSLGKADKLLLGAVKKDRELAEADRLLRQRQPLLFWEEPDPSNFSPGAADTTQIVCSRGLKVTVNPNGIVEEKDKGAPPPPCPDCGQPVSVKETEVRTRASLIHSIGMLPFAFSCSQRPVSSW